MTADELQSIVRRLANNGWCRYWLNYGDRKNDVRMAIQCRDDRGNPEEIHGLIKLGFEIDNEQRMKGNQFFYTIHRSNPDGTPFVSNLF